MRNPAATLRWISFLDIGIFISFPLMYFLTDIPKDFLIVMFVIAMQASIRWRFTFTVNFVYSAVEHIISSVSSKIDVVKVKMSQIRHNDSSTVESTLKDIDNELDSIMDSLSNLDIED